MMISQFEHWHNLYQNVSTEKEEKEQLNSVLREQDL